MTEQLPAGLEADVSLASSRNSRRSHARKFLLYGGLSAVAAALFLLIRSGGEALYARTQTAAATPTAAGSVDVLLQVLLALTAIIVTTRAAGMLFNRFGQPAVVGEIFAGILLGPSLLGRLAPSLSAAVLPVAVMPQLGVIAQLGVILYMFLVGLELDLPHIVRSGEITIAVAHGSILVPFVTGAALALPLYPAFGTASISFTVFALFVGTAMSVTAFPVLARILTDRGMQKTPLGSLALSSAAVGDAAAWCLLTLAVSIAKAQPAEALRTFVLTIAYALVVLVLGSRLVARAIPVLERRGSTRSSLAILVMAILLSAIATEYIGIHAIFGAFLCGAIVPSAARLAAELRQRLEDLVSVLLLPAFFAFTGLRTEIGLVSGWRNWLVCVAIIALACIGKFGGTFAAARLRGIDRRDSAALGVLMNTRGLVELIVLNVGLDLQVITPTFFTMMVIMAVVTTFATTPILHVIAPKLQGAKPA